jgi:hypothetical protein
MDRIYVHVFIRISVDMCMNIYVCTVFLKKVQMSNVVSQMEAHIDIINGVKGTSIVRHYH